MQRLYSALAFALCSAFGVGFNLGSTNLVEPYIRCWINEVTLHNLTETACNNAANTSMPAIQDQLRHVTGYWALAISAAAVGAMIGGFLAELRAWFTAARFLIGINLGVDSMVAPVFIDHISPSRKRDTFGTSYQVAVTIGMLVAEIISIHWIFGTNATWPYVFLCGILPPVVQLVLSFFVPESPVWLAKNLELNRAMGVEKYLKGDEAETDKIQEIFKTDYLGFFESIRGLWSDRTVRASTWQVINLQMIQQITGVYAIFFYSTQVFTTDGIEARYSAFIWLSTIAIGVFNVIGVLIGAKIIKKMNRVDVLFFGLISMCVCAVVATVLLYIPLAKFPLPGNQGQIVAYCTVLPLLAFVFSFELGPGPIPWMIASEMVPNQYMTAAQALGCGVNWFWCFVVTIAFPPVHDAIGQSVFMIFFTTSAICSIYVSGWCVESKDRTIQKVQQEFYKRLL